MNVAVRTVAYVGQQVPSLTHRASHFKRLLTVKCKISRCGDRCPKRGVQDCLTCMRGDFPVHPDRSRGSRWIGIHPNTRAECHEGVGKTIAFILLFRPAKMRKRRRRSREMTRILDRPVDTVATKTATKGCQVDQKQIINKVK